MIRIRRGAEIGKRFYQTVQDDDGQRYAAGSAALEPTWAASSIHRTRRSRGCHRSEDRAEGKLVTLETAIRRLPTTSASPTCSARSKNSRKSKRSRRQGADDAQRELDKLTSSHMDQQEQHRGGREDSPKVAGNRAALLLLLRRKVRRQALRRTRGGKSNTQPVAG